MKKFLIPFALVSVLLSGSLLSCSTIYRHFVPQRNYGASANQAAVSQQGNLEAVVARAGSTLVRVIPENLTVVALNVSANADPVGATVVEELKMRLAASQKFSIIDEKAFTGGGNQRGGFRQSGATDEMTDAAAIAFGQRAVANIVITVDIARLGLTQTLTVKALDTRTSGIVSMFRETF